MSPRAGKKGISAAGPGGFGLMVWRVVCLVALAGTIGFIFCHSAQPASISGAQSRDVLEVVNHMLQAYGLPGVSEYAVRKMAHFAEFTALGWWLVLCARAFFLHHGQIWPWLWAAGTLCAALDESLQLVVPGRAARISDVFLDACGVGCGLALATGAVWLYRHWVRL